MSKTTYVGTCNTCHTNHSTTKPIFDIHGRPYMVCPTENNSVCRWPGSGRKQTTCNQMVDLTALKSK